ncbi:MAG TPA: hypothetical protein EYP68_02030 [Candidatus Korarchaeota archaeon]|nr:hypothetical protein [Candidatus Korarchaeota archaeon]
MGHKLSTYHDVRMKRIELLRGIYASADLKIFPKQRTTLEDILKEIIRARGENPAKYLREQVMSGKVVLMEDDKTEIYAVDIGDASKGEDR